MSDTFTLKIEIVDDGFDPITTRISKPLRFGEDDMITEARRIIDATPYRWCDKVWITPDVDGEDYRIRYVHDGRIQVEEDYSPNDDTVFDRRPNSWCGKDSKTDWETFSEGRAYLLPAKREVLIPEELLPYLEPIAAGWDPKRDLAANIMGSSGSILSPNEALSNLRWHLGGNYFSPIEVMRLVLLYLALRGPKK